MIVIQDPEQIPGVDSLALMAEEDVPPRLIAKAAKDVREPAHFVIDGKVIKMIILNPSVIGNWTPREGPGWIYEIFAEVVRKGVKTRRVEWPGSST